MSVPVLRRAAPDGIASEHPYVWPVSAPVADSAAVRRAVQRTGWAPHRVPITVLELHREVLTGSGTVAEPAAGETGVLGHRMPHEAPVGVPPARLGHASSVAAVGDDAGTTGLSVQTSTVRDEERRRFELPVPGRVVHRHAEEERVVRPAGPVTLPSAAAAWRFTVHRTATVPAGAAAHSPGRAGTPGIPVSRLAAPEGWGIPVGLLNEGEKNGD